MNEGTIVRTKTPEEVFRKPGSEFTADFIGVITLFSGCRTGMGGVSVIDIDGHRIISHTCGVGEYVYASITPGDILVSVEPFVPGARDPSRGRTCDIIGNGPYVRITVGAGIPFVVVSTRLRFREMDTREEDERYLTSRASSVHVSE